VNIKNKIKSYRTKKRLTQKELAILVHISESHLQNIEYGSAKPNVELALKIADSLNVTVEELFRPPRKNSSETGQ
jgi:putative transcriptional regulator